MGAEFLTVSELNQFIRDVVNAGFPRAVWVCGEIQQYDRNKGKKHSFFELVEKDKDSHGVVARVGLVIFANRKAAIEQTLKKSENAFELKDDIEVKFLCQVDFYPPHGAMRLIVEEIDPIYTLGKLAQEKQKLIASLREKEVFEKNKRLAAPVVPLNIGLVTSDDSAAYNDFISELIRSRYGFRVYLRNTLMQGKNCEGDVCRALDELKRVDGLDAVVITRGGGSLAELGCFDSRLIAEHIANYPLPVFSGIGHEINISITDMAAHTFAKTPTAIARHLVSAVDVFLNEALEKGNRIIDSAEERLLRQRHRLKDIAVRLQHETVQFLKEHHMKVARMQETLRLRPAEGLQKRKDHLRDKRDALRKESERYVVNQIKKIGNYQKVIQAYHPANTIKRGFSITRTEKGVLVKSVGDVASGHRLLTEVRDGVLESRLGVIRKEEDFGRS